MTLTRAVAFLTHWGRVKHICVSKLIIIGSDNGLSTGRRQAIIWTSAGVLLIGPLGRNFTEIEIYSFSFWRNWSGLYINQLTIIIYPVYWWWACNGFALYHDKKSHGLCLGNNSSHPGQNHWHFTDDISKCIVVIEKFCIFIKKKSLKFVSKSPIDNNLAMVQIMALRQMGDKTLSMLTLFTDAYMRH